MLAPCLELAGFQLAQAQRSVALDACQADLVGRDSTEGDLTTRRPAVDDALDLTEPERQHFLDVGKRLTRSPRRLWLRAEVVAQRPRLSGLDLRTHVEDR